MPAWARYPFKNWATRSIGRMSLAGGRYTGRWMSREAQGQVLDQEPRVLEEREEADVAHDAGGQPPLLAALRAAALHAHDDQVIDQRAVDDQAQVQRVPPAVEDVRGGHQQPHLQPRALGQAVEGVDDGEERRECPGVEKHRRGVSTPREVPAALARSGTRWHRGQSRRPRTPDTRRPGRSAGTPRPWSSTPRRAARTVFPRPGPAGSGRGCVLVVRRVVDVVAPLGHVAEHVVQAPRVGPLLAHGVRGLAGVLGEPGRIGQRRRRRIEAPPARQAYSHSASVGRR